MEASNDEEDIFSAADNLENNELLPLSLLPVNFFTLCGVRVCPLRYPELSGDRPAPAKIALSRVRYSSRYRWRCSNNNCM